MTARRPERDEQRGTLSLFQQTRTASPRSGIGYAGEHSNGIAPIVGWEDLAGVAEVAAPALVAPSAAEVLRDVLRASAAPTVAEALGVALAAVIERLAAHLAVACVADPGSGERPVLVARRATPGGSADAPDVVSELVGVLPEHADHVVASLVAPRQVFALTLDLGGEATGTAWVAFARAVAHEGEGGALATARDAVSLAVRAGMAREAAPRAEAVRADAARRAEVLREREALVYRLHRDAVLGRVAASAAREVGGAQAAIAVDLAGLQYELAGARAGCALEDHVDASLKLVASALDTADRVREAASGMVRLGNIATNPARRADPREVADAMVALVASQLARRARVARALDPVPHVALAPGRLALVLLNLLVNAAQALPDGRPDEHTVRVETSTEGGMVVIAVQDDGCGIPADRLERIFEPFYSTRSPAVGAGLGLAICHEIVSQARGVIEVESVVGVGTTVRVALPVASPSLQL